MKRIDLLRNQVFEKLHFSDEFYYLFYTNYARNTGSAEEERYAEAFYFAFSTLTPSISDGELIVGKCDIPLSNEKLRQWQNTYKAIAAARKNKAGDGQDSHMAIDYELVLSKGLNGIIHTIDRCLLTCGKKTEAFYKCCKRCLEAVIRYSENYADLALKMSRETADPIRQRELEKIGEICRKVPASPAGSFYEAVQSVHFISHCLSLNPFRLGCQQFQLGHPDRYLLKFYQNDIQKGIITKEYAQLLLDCLGIQINMRVPSGLSSGYMVGGRNRNGEIVANDLTEMCMQVIDDIRLV